MFYLFVVAIMSGPYQGEYTLDSHLTREDCGSAIYNGVSAITLPNHVVVKMPETAILFCIPDLKGA